MKEQQAFILAYAVRKDVSDVNRLEESSNIGKLNALLKKGWRIVSSSAMGGTGSARDLVACMVVLEKDAET